MKKAIVLALALIVAGTGAYANDSNLRTGGGGYGPFSDGYANVRDESDVLIYQCREANEGFADLIPFYEAALTAGGATVTGIDAPSGGGALPDLDPCFIPVIFVLTTENWFAPNFPPGDEALVQAYLEAGGALYLSGQDYLYGAGYLDGPQSGFPYFIGLDSVTQDTPFGADFMDVLGAGMFEGYYLFLDFTHCYGVEGNPFYPDETIPRADGGADLWQQISPETHMGALNFDGPGYRTIFSTIELAGDVLGEFPGVVVASWEWLKENAPVATETTTVGAVKASYK